MLLLFVALLWGTALIPKSEYKNDPNKERLELPKMEPEASHKSFKTNIEMKKTPRRTLLRTLPYGESGLRIVD